MILDRKQEDTEFLSNAEPTLVRIWSNRIIAGTELGQKGTWTLAKNATLGTGGDDKP